MRFVKSFEDAISVGEKRKIEKMRKRQREFLKTIRKSSSYDILELDMAFGAEEEENPTVRQMIMSIQSAGENKVPLFHSVDLDYTGSGYTFQYSNNVAEEAECVVNTLIPYIEYFFPEAEEYMDELFDQDALARCEDLIYDEKTGGVKDVNCSNTIEIEADEELE